MRLSSYSAEYYEEIEQWSRSSAPAVVSWAIQALRPASVVDVGCGTGVWLETFKRAGVGRLLGLDGHCVPAEALRIPAQSFRRVDLTQPLPGLDRFDLALCLEVVEHLPESAAQTIIATLTSLAPVILFSAAVPGQGGDHHVNEQWPAYWAERFAKHGYSAFDPLRARLWRDPTVAWWFAQNITLYVAQNAALPDTVLEQLAPFQVQEPLALVHPDMLAAVQRELKKLRSLRGILQTMTAISRGHLRKTILRLPISSR